MSSWEDIGKNLGLDGKLLALIDENGEPERVSLTQEGNDPFDNEFLGRYLSSTFGRAYYCSPTGWTDGEAPNEAVCTVERDIYGHVPPTETIHSVTDLRRWVSDYRADLTDAERDELTETIQDRDDRPPWGTDWGWYLYRAMFIDSLIDKIVDPASHLPREIQSLRNVTSKMGSRAAKIAGNLAVDIVKLFDQLGEPIQTLSSQAVVERTEQLLQQAERLPTLMKDFQDRCVHLRELQEAVLDRQPESGGKSE